MCYLAAVTIVSSVSLLDVLLSSLMPQKKEPNAPPEIENIM